jgi:hypothetical protein
MRSKLSFLFRCNAPAFKCGCQVFLPKSRKFIFWKSAPAPTARQAVKGIDHFQLAMATFVNGMQRTQS